MGCRVGITTDVEGRKAHWQNEYKYRKFRNWQIVQTFSSKTAAQEWETSYSTKSGCVSHPGGEGSERATWYGYRFDFD